MNEGNSQRHNTRRNNMASIIINDLDVNQELDSNALQNILGGRWVTRVYRRAYRKRYVRYYRRTVRYSRVHYRTAYRYYRRRTWVS